MSLGIWDVWVLASYRSYLELSNRNVHVNAINLWPGMSPRKNGLGFCLATAHAQLEHTIWGLGFRAGRKTANIMPMTISHLMLMMMMTPPDIEAHYPLISTIPRRLRCTTMGVKYDIPIPQWEYSLFEGWEVSILGGEDYEQLGCC